MTPELIAELREALEAKEAAREEHARREVKAADARAGALEARKAWRAACDRVEEIEAEIRTGLSGMPLVDLAAGARVEPFGTLAADGKVVLTDREAAEFEAELAAIERAGRERRRLADEAPPVVVEPEPRRFVPKSAADHEPVRVAKGSPRAAGVAR